MTKIHHFQITLTHGYSGGICEDQIMSVAVHDSDNEWCGNLHYEWCDGFMTTKVECSGTLLTDFELLIHVTKTIWDAFNSDLEFYSDAFYDADGNSIALPMVIER